MPSRRVGRRARSRPEFHGVLTGASALTAAPNITIRMPGHRVRRLVDAPSRPASPHPRPGPNRSPHSRLCARLAVEADGALDLSRADGVVGVGLRGDRIRVTGTVTVTVTGKVTNTVKVSSDVVVR